MTLKSGTRLRSQVDTTQIIVGGPDHVRPEIGQQHPGGPPGDATGQLKNPDAGERRG